ncbi:MAG: CRISPR-associated protein Csx20 [Sulfurovum sp.]|nr:CRISPR-associated protein Csx20 [Sulfurovum sp.]
MQKLYLLFNHTLTAEQFSDAKASLSCNAVVSPPKDLQDLWSNVPPELESLSCYLQPIKEYIHANVQKNDFVLVQGDFGATYMIVNFVKNLGAIPVYATTSRNVVEATEGGKTIKRSVFKHERYRKYE